MQNLEEGESVGCNPAQDSLHGNEIEANKEKNSEACTYRYDRHKY